MKRKEKKKKNQQTPFVCVSKAVPFSPTQMVIQKALRYLLSFLLRPDKQNQLVLRPKQDQEIRIKQTIALLPWNEATDKLTRTKPDSSRPGDTRKSKRAINNPVIRSRLDSSIIGE